MGNTESCQICNNTDIERKYRKNNICSNLCELQQSSQNKKPLTPILFSDMGSINQQDHQTNKTKQAFQKQLQSKVQVTTGQPINSDDKKSQLFQKEQSSQYNGHMVIVDLAQNQTQIYGAQNYQPLSVPFSVIKLTINNSIAKQINSYDKEFFKLHQKPSDQFFNTWKLQPSGYYSNFIKDTKYILISQKYFYQGNCSAKDKKFILQGQGVLISKDGIFKGKFRNSRAYGTGKYYQLKQKKRCQGTWKDGQLTNGSISTSQYLYNGQLQKGLPSGFGKLIIKHKNITYQGNFLSGKFNDKKGQYTCKQYNYIGGFKEGKKNGQGTLKEKDSQINKKKNKRRQLLTLSGLWKDDVLVQQHKIS